MDAEFLKIQQISYRDIETGFNIISEILDIRLRQ